MTLSFAKPELARVGRVMRCAIAATITVAVCSGQTAAQERIARNDAGSPPRANTVTHSMRTFVDSIVIPSSLSSESRVLRGRATTALLAQASSQPKFGALSADSARKLAAKLRWRLAHGTRRGTSALPLLIELLDALGAPSKAEVHAALQRLKGVEVRETVRESASGTAKRRDFYAAGVLKLSLFTSSAATTDVSREAPDPEPTGTVDAYSTARLRQPVAVPDWCTGYDINGEYVESECATEADWDDFAVAFAAALAAGDAAVGDYEANQEVIDYDAYCYDHPEDSGCQAMKDTASVAISGEMIGHEPYADVAPTAACSVAAINSIGRVPKDCTGEAVGAVGGVLSWLGSRFLTTRWANSMWTKTAAELAEVTTAEIGVTIGLTVLAAAGVGMAIGYYASCRWG